MGQWSELPEALLVPIEELLDLYIDKIRIRAVCTLWNSHLPKMPSHRVKQLPWLLQAFDKNTKATHGLFDLSEKKYYQLNLPELQRMLFKGSSHGWILTVQDVNKTPIRSINRANMFLINPLIGVQIQLPPRSTFPDVVEFIADRDKYCLQRHDGVTYCVNSERVNVELTHKLVLSTIPSSEDCVVVAIYGEDSNRILAWCKINDKKWTPLHIDRQRYYSTIEDVIFCKGKLLALNCLGEVVVLDNICVDPTATILVQNCYLPNHMYLVENRYLPLANHMYLVEGSDEEGLMVALPYNGEDLNGQRREESIRNSCFRLFKLDPINSRWVEVQKIGDDMMFLGSNSSFSISSREFPGWEGSRIYFTDIWFQDRRILGTGVFNLLGDGSAESLPGFKCEVEFLSQPPVWLTRPSYC